MHFILSNPVVTMPVDFNTVSTMAAGIDITSATWCDLIAAGDMDRTAAHINYQFLEMQAQRLIATINLFRVAVDDKDLCEFEVGTITEALGRLAAALPPAN